MMRACKSCLVTVFLVLAPLLVLSGCGSDGRLGVQGKVSFQGKPLPDGTILFVPEDSSAGGSAAGSVIKDGMYSFKADQGLLPGKYKVQISSADSSKMVKPDGPPGPESGKKVAMERIPEEFNVSSKLVVEVASGKTSHDFEIPAK